MGPIRLSRPLSQIFAGAELVAATIAGVASAFWSPGPLPAYAPQFFGFTAFCVVTLVGIGFWFEAWFADRSREVLALLGPPQNATATPSLVVAVRGISEQVRQLAAVLNQHSTELNDANVVLAATLRQPLIPLHHQATGRRLRLRQ
jgi:hypothetical protein